MCVRVLQFLPKQPDKITGNSTFRILCVVHKELAQALLEHFPTKMSKPHVTDQYFLDELSSLVGPKEAVEWYGTIRSSFRRKGSIIFDEHRRGSAPINQNIRVSKTASLHSSSSESSMNEGSSPLVRQHPNQSSMNEGSSPLVRQHPNQVRMPDDDSAMVEPEGCKQPSSKEHTSEDHGLLFTDAAHTIINRDGKREQ